MKRNTSQAAASIAMPVPTHWSPEQALAVLECLAMREAIWSTYGPQVRQAWRDQLLPSPDFDPDLPL